MNDNGQRHYSRRTILMSALGMGVTAMIPTTIVKGMGVLADQGDRGRTRHIIPTLSAFTHVRDEGAVISTEGSERLYINETARYVLTLCDGRHSLDAIAVSMARSFAIPYSQALHDAQFVVSFFHGRGMVKV